MQCAGHGSVAAVRQSHSLADVQLSKKKKKRENTFNAEVILAQRRGLLYLHFHHSLLYTQVLP